MKKLLFPGLATLGLTLLVSCSSVKYITDYDSRVNFYQYGTYNFTPAADSIPINQLTKRRLFDAISTEMNNSGIRWAAEPDIFVHVHMILKGKTRTNVTYGNGETISLGSGFTNTYMDMSEYSEGSIFFDIIDASRKQLVWTGKITGDLTKNIPWKEQDIQNAVQKLFKKFPPKPPR